jgi:WD40 repeat protein
MLVLNPRMRVVDQLAFDHDGRQLFAAGSNVPDLRYKPGNRGIDVWDATGNPDPADRLFPTDLITGFAVNPAGRWLYIGTGYDHDETASAYHAIDLTTKEPTRLGLSAGNAFTLAVHSSGGWLVGAGNLGDWRSHRLVRWRQPPDKPPQPEWERPPSESRFYTRHVACDPVEDRLVTQEIESGIAVRDQVYKLTVREPDTGKPREEIWVPGRTIDQLLIAPNGSWLVVRAGPSLLVWDCDDLDRKPRKVGYSSPKHITGIAFHPSGQYLAATSNDTTVKLYDTATWRLARTFTWNIGRLRSVAFSPDGTRGAVGSDTGKVVVWDVDLL